MLREELGVEATLIGGRSGIFEVKVADVVVAKKTWDGFPSEDAILQAVRKALLEH